MLANRARRPFVDLDIETLRHFGEPTIRSVWERLGEAAWRAVEAEELEGMLARPGSVIALGGGTPMIERARQAIEHARACGRARVVYLRACPAVLRERLSSAAGDRASLTGRGVIEEVEQILSLREPTYMALSDLVVDTDTESIQQIVDRLARLWFPGIDPGADVKAV